jgi:hypothetical protein
MHTAREEHTATLLPSGLVLVAGGVNSSYTPLANAEFYDWMTGAWTTTGSLRTARYNQTATLLPDGLVLVAGGEGSSALPNAELYNAQSY